MTKCRMCGHDGQEISEYSGMFLCMGCLDAEIDWLQDNPQITFNTLSQDDDEEVAK